MITGHGHDHVGEGAGVVPDVRPESYQGPADYATDHDSAFFVVKLHGIGIA